MFWRAAAAGGVGRGEDATSLTSLLAAAANASSAFFSRAAGEEGAAVVGGGGALLDYRSGESERGSPLDGGDAATHSSDALQPEEGALARGTERRKSSRVEGVG
eukprot:CAMPEP_0197606844 /NCGR_PEP_ID=MMETSP1326-20131121/45920_1 /TAXON_ID=1155430 /ORGANISM="Genus nov. species nov., Strain RCC2288" /LENGTH=103 /DNA_ID=CAMNT_0043174831 /DNA_START=45 /DNA_END=352 /DNA_ORIENTATION=+